MDSKTFVCLFYSRKGLGKEGGGGGVEGSKLPRETILWMSVSPPVNEEVKFFSHTRSHLASTCPHLNSEAEPWLSGSNTNQSTPLRQRD